MCYFSVLSIIFAILEVLAQPSVHSDASFVIIMDLKDSIFENHPTIALLILGCASGSFETTIYAIAVNFVYRFFAIQREGRQRYFSGKLLFAWMIVPILIGMISMIIILLMGPNGYMTEHLRSSLKNIYDLDIDKTVYSGCLYWKTDEFGVDHFNWAYISGVLTLNIFMIIAFIVICFFGTRSYFKIRILISHGESEYSRKLQSQLYHALVAQTLIPLIFLFLPVGVYFICPFLGWRIEYGSLSFTLLYALFPALDPIPIIFMIDDYRNAFLNFFRRVLQKNQVASVTSYDRNMDSIS